MASNSSMKIIAGAFSLAKAKASLTILAPSPINICVQVSIQTCPLSHFKRDYHHCITIIVSKLLEYLGKTNGLLVY